MATEETPRNHLSHVAVIMDGNGRWAQSRGLNRLEGHRVGADSVQAVVKECVESQIPYLTLYAFSSENWSRPKLEVEGLMELLRKFLTTKSKEMHEQGIRLRAIGRIDQLPQKVREALVKATERTKNNSKLTLTLALSYGGREEIVDATKRIAAQVVSGELTLDQITNSVVSDNLYTADLPDPDVLIRTSGEVRLSNFLLWQLSYAELVMSPVCWPDFRAHEFQACIEEYHQRRRRFGKV